MIIRDVDGGRLSLTKTKLTEVTLKNGDRVIYPSSLLLRDLRAAEAGRVQLHCKLRMPARSLIVDYYFDLYRIGCRTFSPATFTKILKAAGINVARKKGEEVMRTKYYNFKTTLYSFRIFRAKAGLWTAKVYSSSPKRWLNVLYPNGEKANRPKKRELQEYLIYVYGGK